MLGRRGRPLLAGRGRRWLARIAQPTAETHPHLMRPGETTPGLPATEFRDRRARLAQQLPDGAAALFPSSVVGYMSHDVRPPARSATFPPMRRRHPAARRCRSRTYPTPTCST